MGGSGGDGSATQLWGRVMERGLFWIERIGIFVVSLYWVLVVQPQDQPSLTAPVASRIIAPVYSPRFLTVLLTGFLIFINNAYMLAVHIGGRDEPASWAKLFSEQKPKTPLAQVRLIQIPS